MSPSQLLRVSQFHGANRLADKESRWWWIPAMLLLLGTAVTVVCLTITRYLENPTYIVQVETLHPSVEFPNVIVCPEIEFSEHKMDQFISEIKFPAGLNASFIREVLPQLAAFYSPDMPYRVKDLEMIEHLLDFNGMDVETVSRKLTATCEEILIKCRWNDALKNCSSMFRMEFTADGFCCVFNGRSLRREMNDYGTYVKERKGVWYTRRFGYSGGLMMAVNQSQQIPLSIDLAYKWIALQPSQHFVDTSVNGTALNPGYEQWVAYYTRNFRITQIAKELSPKLRKCKMAEERLRYFPTYNRRYCILECEIANTLKRCQCVRAAHPLPPGAARCRARSLLCAKHAMISFGSSSCECPETCDVETEYMRSSSFELVKDTHSPIDGFYENLDFHKVTIVRTFIQKRLKKTMERWSYYSYFDLFAQLGGDINVFFGCSVLTMMGILQIFYRVLANLKHCQN